MLNEVFWDEIFLAFCEIIATRSSHGIMRNGAIIVSHKLNNNRPFIVSMGYAENFKEAEIQAIQNIADPENVGEIILYCLYGPSIDLIEKICSRIKCIVRIVCLYDQFTSKDVIDFLKQNKIEFLKCSIDRQKFV